ncbi:MAG: ribosome small subunit-dependent GTPase A [Coriobacteriia bacterium]|nr:ribosome small subunit-dependent GTPase A [Coriobacteriia bacterium]
MTEPTDTCTDTSADQSRQGLVVSLDRGYPLVRFEATPGGVFQEIRAQHSTELVKNAAVRATVGDCVELIFPPDQDTPLITAIAPRRTALVRRSMVESIHEGSGRFEEQVLAANMDIVFVVTALGVRPIDGEYLSRQLVMAFQSGADVALILTKADQAVYLEADLAQAGRIAPDCPIVVESAVTGQGFEEIIEILAPNRIAVLLGRSGVGKSTLINKLLGAPLLKTGDVRTKDRGGRHTTVARRLVMLPQGGGLIDTPGLRSLGLYGAYDGLTHTFPDIAEYAGACRYRDCTHTNEPDCGVKAAVLSGALDARRLATYISIYPEVND